VRERYLELRADPAHLRAVLAAGAERAETVAAATIALIKERMGFVPRG
jgi:tryptophanyl-tRNA synthetase